MSVPARVALAGSVPFVQVAAYPTLTAPGVPIVVGDVTIVTGPTSRNPTVHGSDRVRYPAVRVGESTTVRSARSAVGGVPGRVAMAHAPARVGRAA